MGGKERNIDQLCTGTRDWIPQPGYVPWLWIEPATPQCMGWPQPTEPHGSGPNITFICTGKAKNLCDLFYCDALFIVGPGTEPAISPRFVCIVLGYTMCKDFIRGMCLRENEGAVQNSESSDCDSDLTHREWEESLDEV